MTLVRDICRGLLLLVVIPLRLIAGRPLVRHLDYDRIAELEIDCGLREPDALTRPRPAGIGYKNIEQSAPPPPDIVDEAIAWLRGAGGDLVGRAAQAGPLVVINDDSDGTTAAALRNRRFRTWEYAKAIVQQAEAQNRGLTAREDECFRWLSDELNGMDRRITAIAEVSMHDVTCRCRRCDWRHDR